ncbi:hypothetical protein ACFPAF_09850 [Hymenobacter endophyticus]|uniref:Uncharacterized protein n=1 Tax=Hymenobacter endophyticus TaxID=3076335 RepID=A0ABU3THI2_9BACT|nr:hypothetical protein [Hymenobacter endophyticus]MDU0370695.1 hypothetical protein [Hymenobacter endophyticus]
MAEEYADKMSRKTDAELRDYVANRFQYREDAVLAAIQEAERRQLALPDLDVAQLRQELSAVITQQQATRQQLEAEQAQAETEVPEAGPLLYSPTAITVFSLCVSPVVGAVLLAINLRRLQRVGATGRLVLFVLAYLAVRLALVASGQMVLALIAEVGAVLAYSLWFWPRYIRVSQFQSRNWAVLFLVCVAVSLAWGLLIVQNNPQVQQMIEQMRTATTK